MRKHRFFLSTELQVKQNLELDQDLSHQILRVLRLGIGDTIFLFNNTDCEFAATITNVNRKNVSIEIADQKIASIESPLSINLGQVLNKGDKMDLVIQKATELGVHSITPLYSEHAVIKPTADRTDNKIAHWQKIAIAACCQCGRNQLPIINPPQHLLTWINNNTDPNKLILSPSDTAHKLKQLNINAPITILIGPEGGFSTTEINMALKHDFKQISLGPRILRTETAGLAVIAILQAMYGDL